MQPRRALRNVPGAADVAVTEWLNTLADNIVVGRINAITFNYKRYCPSVVQAVRTWPRRNGRPERGGNTFVGQSNVVLRTNTAAGAEAVASFPAVVITSRNRHHTHGSYAVFPDRAHARNGNGTVPRLFITLARPPKGRVPRRYNGNVTTRAQVYLYNPESRESTDGR